VDLSTAIVSTIQALAWPATVFGGVLILRHEIRALLNRISGIKYKELEISIGEKLIVIGKELTPKMLPSLAPKDASATKERKEEENEVAELMGLAARSPRDAIVESWIRLQHVVIGIARSKGHDFLSATVHMPYARNALWFLHTNKLINDKVLAAVAQLWDIYDKISQNPGFKPDPSLARDFVLYSFSVKEQLEEIQ
jgi:hypothetical protein